MCMIVDRMIAIIVLFFFLIQSTGCESAQHRHERNVDSAKAYVFENEQQVREAADWLISRYSETTERPDYGCSIRIEKNEDRGIAAKNSFTGETEIIENQACEALLTQWDIEFITVYVNDDRSTVQFELDGVGFGPETGYYYVAYVPSGYISDVWFYNSHFSYVEKDGGMFGRETEEGGDNTFFYLPLADDLFYCEAFF